MSSVGFDVDVVRLLVHKELKKSQSLYVKFKTWVMDHFVSAMERKDMGYHGIDIFVALMADKISNKCLIPKTSPAKRWPAWASVVFRSFFEILYFLSSFGAYTSSIMFRALSVRSLPQTRTLATHATPRSGASVTRHNWRRQEIKDIFQSPLMDLVFRAAAVHRDHHDPSKIQLCTLMNIKSALFPH